MGNFFGSVLFNNHRLIILFNLLAGFLLVIALLLLVRDIVSLSVRHPEKASAGVAETSNATREKLEDYAVIMRNNPFGFPAGDLRALSDIKPAIFNEDVSLIGTVAGDKKLSYAIFMDRKGRQEIFRVGDSVFGLGALENVEKDRVFIRGGREIPLSDIPVGRDTRTRYASIHSPAKLSRRISDDTYAINQEKILQAIENPKELMTDARLLPNFVNGSQQGFVMKEVKQGGIYHSLGLRNGDVLLRINDFDISNPENALQAFNALRGMERVQLDILRGGSKMTMTYQIQ